MSVRLLIILIHLGLFLGVSTGQESQLLDILKRHELTRTSLIHSDGTKTLILKGFHRKNDEVLEIIMKRKDPNKLRVDYEQNGFAVTIAYNGETGWQRKEKGDFVNVDTYIPGEFDWLKLTADFRGYLLRFLAGEVGIEVDLLENVEFRGRKLYSISTSHPDAHINYYLNSSTYYLEKMEVLKPDGSLLEEILFSDYRMVDGIPISYRQDFKNSNGQPYTYRWDKVIINAVVYDFIFEKPKY